MAEEQHCGGGARKKGMTMIRSHLPEELVEEILCHLPVKSITRFNSVCKTWRSRFHSRRFIHLYALRRRSEDPPFDELHSIPHEDLTGMIPGLQDPPLLQYLNNLKEDQEWDEGIQIVGPSSNGIYCLAFLYWQPDSFRIFTPSIKIALCNPATRGYKIAEPLPPCVASLKDMNGEINIGLDDRHEMVLILNYAKAFICLVYRQKRSVPGGEWKRIVDYKRGRPKKSNVGQTAVFRSISMLLPSFEACPQKLLAGCWHWVAVARSSTSYRVLSFDFAAEAFKLMGTPPGGGHHDNPTTSAMVFVLRDRLAFIYLLFDSNDPWQPQQQCLEVDVWMMMEYGVEESWTRVYKINPNFNGSRFLTLLGMEYDSSPKSIDIKRLIFQDRDDKEGRVISCDEVGHQVLEDEVFWDNCDEELEEEGLCDNYSFLNTLGISTYVETLEPL